MIPKDNDVWGVWEENLKKYDQPFMTDRNQHDSQQEWDGLNDQFI